MKIETITSHDHVTCQRCGTEVEQRNAIGVGAGAPTVWTCYGCVERYGMDEAFASLGRTVSMVQKLAMAMTAEQYAKDLGVIDDH